MKTNIKREIEKALNEIAERHSGLDEWLVCSHDIYPSITFSIFKSGDNEKRTTVTIQDVDFLIYDGIKESDILPIAHKIIKEIKEVQI